MIKSFFAFIAATLCAMPLTARAADFVVTTGGDAGIGSLRQAITDAALNTEADTIRFDGNVRGVIRLAGALPDLTGDITLTGPGAGLLTVRRETGGDYRIFNVAVDANVHLSGLTITNGATIGAGVGNSGTLELSGCVLRDNHATDGSSGGGIASGATLIVRDCLIVDNSAVYGGGGIAAGGPTTIINTTIANNSSDFGGGVASGDALTMRNCTLSGNIATGTFETSTNASPSGGGALAIFYNTSRATIDSCTIADNSAPNVASGARGGVWLQAGTLSLRNSIVARNQARDILKTGGTLTNAGFNLIGNNAGVEALFPTGNLVGTASSPLDPRLLPLEDNGGPVPTRALEAGSPALHAGATDEMADQRGILRPQGTADDIGAFEALGVNARPQNVSLSPDSLNTAPGESGLLRAVYEDANGARDIKLASLQLGASARFGLRALYDRAANKLFLLNDLGTAYIGGFAPGSANVISTGQGSLDCERTMVSVSGTRLQIDWSLSPGGPLAISPKQSVGHSMQLYVSDAGGLSDGFDAFGAWTISGNVAPVNAGLLPAGSVQNRVGQARLFRATYSDANGYANIRYAYLQVKTGSSGVLRVAYDLLNNKLYILGDDGKYKGGFKPGTARTLTASQGAISCQQTIVRALDATTMQVDWVIAAGAPLAGGNHPVLLYSTDRGGLSDGFDPGATWTITSQ